jgi:hypothetical protein
MVTHELPYNSLKTLKAIPAPFICCMQTLGGPYFPCLRTVALCISYLVLFLPLERVADKGR